MIGAQSWIRPYGMRLGDTHRVTTTQDRGKVVPLVDIVHQYREVGLAGRQYGFQSSEALRCHVEIQARFDTATQVPGAPQHTGTPTGLCAAVYNPRCADLLLQRDHCQ